MNRLAIIPARGGSKRIPRKNIKEFLGVPIIGYSILAALESEIFDEVMVSTDDQEIADIAISFGASVPFLRSADTSNDFASTFDVIEEVIQQYAEKGIEYHQACCIYATAPFVTSKFLKLGLSQLLKGYDTVFPVIPFGYPIQRALKLTSNEKIEMFNPEHMTSRSQDLEKGYQDSGQFYWMDVAKVLESKKLWTDNSGAIILSEMDAHDIDTIEDWKVAEFKYQISNG